jgi:hypothetical protein
VLIISLLALFGLLRSCRAFFWSGFLIVLIAKLSVIASCATRLSSFLKVKGLFVFKSSITLA